MQKSTYLCRSVCEWGKPIEMINLSLLHGKSMENQNDNSIFARVNHIISTMENDSTPIDELSKKRKEVYELIEKLKSTTI